MGDLARGMERRWLRSISARMVAGPAAWDAVQRVSYMKRGGRARKKRSTIVQIHVLPLGARGGAPECGIVSPLLRRREDSVDGLQAMFVALARVGQRDAGAPRHESQLGAWSCTTPRAGAYLP